MKIALCLYGLVGSVSDKNGVGQPLNPEIAFKLNHKNLISGNDVDIFMHSWSLGHRERLLELYKPKKFIIEQQLEFPDSSALVDNIKFKEKLCDIYKKIFSPNSFKKSYSERAQYAFRAYSRWYSNKKALELKKEYESETRIKYDCVMILRLDVGFYTKLDWNSYDLNYFYASNWNDAPSKHNNFQNNFDNKHLGKGFLDLWFFSNSEYMDQFSKLFDHINEYNISPHYSSYEHVRGFTNNIKYTKYRWTDFEMIRRKEFASDK